MPSESDLKKRVDTPTISTALLNWNRLDLLKRTLDSYLATITVPYELLIVDNGSTDGSREYIEAMCAGRRNHQCLLNAENIGGEALNLAIERCTAPYIHITENDVEYLPHWDTELLAKLKVFPEVGQLSLFAPGGNPVTALSRSGMSINIAETNITNTWVGPRAVYASSNGPRWTTHGNETVHFPSDARFSRAVKAAGFVPAWNDVNLAINLGFRAEEFLFRLPYYLESYAARPGTPARPGGLQALDRRLRGFGYQLVQDRQGNWDAAPLPATVVATPNPVITTGGRGVSTIGWNTGTSTKGHVTVSRDGGAEKGFGGGVVGRKAAQWIVAGSKYVFRLYVNDERAELLASVTVTGRHPRETA